MDINVTIPVDNIDEVKNIVEDAIETALEAIGMQAETYAKALCPVDTGNLRNSITHEQDGDSEIIGTNVEYAPYVELGHRMPNGGYVAPQPYLAPAVNDHISEYISMVEEILHNS